MTPNQDARFNGDNLVCPECEAQIVAWNSGWDCSICGLDSERYAQTLLTAADLLAHEVGR